MTARMLALLVAVGVAGCATVAPTPGGGTGPTPRSPFVCKGGPQNECDLDVQPNGQWVPTLIEAHRGSDNRYPRIRWTLDANSPFKFVGQGIFFEGNAAKLFECSASGNRKMVTCENRAPATAESEKYRYRVQIELDPFVWNR